jgi:hypothetical protein
LCWGALLLFHNILCCCFFFLLFPASFYEALYFVNEWWGDERIDDLFGIPSLFFSLFVIYVALCFKKKFSFWDVILRECLFFFCPFLPFFLIQIVHNHLDSPPIIPTHTNGSK